MRFNNVDVENVEKLVKEITENPEKAFITKKVAGEWVFKEGEPQFKAFLKYENGEAVVEADSPTKMGGSGLRPDPVQYCMMGLIACFAQTYVGIATEKGVKLTKLRVEAVNKINLRRPLGVGDDPITEGIKLKVYAEGAPEDVLNEIMELAMKRCPGVYCVTNPIPIEPQLNPSGE